MKKKTILNRAKREREKLKKLRKDSRYKRVLGFLQAKGLLYTLDIVSQPNIKINISDALWVAENIEPRVLEVLPAAVISFPSTFVHKEDLPPELENIIRKIRLGKKITGTYKGIECRKMLFWAKQSLTDGRMKPIGEKRITKTYRFLPETVKKLKNASVTAKLNETAFLEKIINERI